MLKYSLFGSCATRDASDLGHAPLPRPSSYFSRCKIQSLVSAPTWIDSDDIGLVSPFQTRVVLEDHRKTGLPVMAGLDHPLVIDLIDERFRLVACGDGLVTDSSYFRMSRLPSQNTYKPVADDASLARDGAFATACEQLAKGLSGTTVIVHRAMWATHSVTGAPLAKAAYAQQNNDWLTRAYDVLEAAFPDGGSITPASEVVLADPEHRWGLDPFHYIADYYDDVSGQIRDFL